MEKKYNSEEEFLKDYDSSRFEKLSMTADILIFSISDEATNNYRKLSKKHFSVLLVKRDDYPFKDKWCLPGGFVQIDEDLENETKRIRSSSLSYREHPEISETHQDPGSQGKDRAKNHDTYVREQSIRSPAGQERSQSCCQRSLHNRDQKRQGRGYRTAAEKERIL